MWSQLKKIHDLYTKSVNTYNKGNIPHMTQNEEKKKLTQQEKIEKYEQGDVTPPPSPKRKKKRFYKKNSKEKHACDWWTGRCHHVCCWV